MLPGLLDEDLVCPFLQVMMYVILHLDAAYTIPNVSFKGAVCKTNLPPNTAFRGFGMPQATFFTEQIISLVTHQLGLPRDTVCSTNMKNEGDTTPFGMVLNNCSLRRCWTELEGTDVYKKRVMDVQEFNRYNHASAWTFLKMSHY